MKMRRTVIILFALLFTVVLQAQDLKFGIFNYEAVLQSMPDYIAAQQDLSQLRSQYDAETKRTEDEFNVKYEAFLEEQSSLAPTIRNKRQLELQDMMERGITFRKRRNVYWSRQRKMRSLLSRTACRRPSSSLGVNADMPSSLMPTARQYPT